MDLSSSFPSQYDESRMNESRMNFEDNKVDETMASTDNVKEDIDEALIEDLLKSDNEEESRNFECCMCFKNFKSAKGLKIHKTMSHVKSCKTCAKQFQSLQALCRHMKQEHDKKFNLLKKKRKNKNQTFEANTEFSAPFSEEGSQNLEHSMITLEPEKEPKKKVIKVFPFPCSKCGQIFSSQRKIKTHVLMFHTDIEKVFDKKIKENGKYLQKRNKYLEKKNKILSLKLKKCESKLIEKELEEKNVDTSKVLSEKTIIEENGEIEMSTDETGQNIEKNQSLDEKQQDLQRNLAALKEEVVLVEKESFVYCGLFPDTDETLSWSGEKEIKHLECMDIQLENRTCVKCEKHLSGYKEVARHLPEHFQPSNIQVGTGITKNLNIVDTDPDPDTNFDVDQELNLYVEKSKKVVCNVVMENVKSDLFSYNTSGYFAKKPEDSLLTNLLIYLRKNCGESMFEGLRAFIDNCTPKEFLDLLVSKSLENLTMSVLLEEKVMQLTSEISEEVWWRLFNEIVLQSTEVMFAINIIILDVQNVKAESQERKNMYMKHRNIDLKDKRSDLFITMSPIREAEATVLRSDEVIVDKKLESKVTGESISRVYKGKLFSELSRSHTKYDSTEELLDLYAKESIKTCEKLNFKPKYKNGEFAKFIVTDLPRPSQKDLTGLIDIEEKIENKGRPLCLNVLFETRDKTFSQRVNLEHNVFKVRDEDIIFFNERSNEEGETFCTFETQKGHFELGSLKFKVNYNSLGELALRIIIAVQKIFNIKSEEELRGLNDDMKAKFLRQTLEHIVDSVMTFCRRQTVMPCSKIVFGDIEFFMSLLFQKKSLILSSFELSRSFTVEFENRFRRYFQNNDVKKGFIIYMSYFFVRKFLYNRNETKEFFERLVTDCEKSNENESYIGSIVKFCDYLIERNKQKKCLLEQ